MGYDPLKHPIETFKEIGGFYECPKDAASGKRLGPLVGYAGRYDGEHQWVGEVYVNCAKAEENANVMTVFATLIRNKLRARDLEGINVFCGAPMGGLALACTLAQMASKRYIYPEKKVVALATEDSREKTKLVFGRHEVPHGSAVAIVEDVTNNFSTTEDMIRLIMDNGASVAAIVSLLNRSLNVDDLYISEAAGNIPVVSMIRKPFGQWRQDDPEVIEDIKAGNVVLKPKAEWDKLQQAMAVHT